MATTTGSRFRADVFGTSSALKTLTGSFVADTAVGNTIAADGFNNFTMNISFTSGSATGEFCDVQVETSNDGTNFFVWSETSSPNASPATQLGISGTYYRTPIDTTTPGATTNYKRSYSFKAQAKFLRFKVKSSAGANFGSAWVEVNASEI